MPRAGGYAPVTRCGCPGMKLRALLAGGAGCRILTAAVLWSHTGPCERGYISSPILLISTLTAIPDDMAASHWADHPKSDV
ncbi:hypothetical protein MATL_G00263560 [Megalops atlanticus]|uniref:Uncharacterized protein n=1 Tax=Megalops atlanticus TaxID=7932 RepID=A0A9D3P9C2_MEGAT|nr:hypothetical protein MATL_G00263560 [Megalops atlanticus]